MEDSKNVFTQNLEIIKRLSEIALAGCKKNDSCNLGYKNQEFDLEFILNKIYFETYHNLLGIVGEAIKQFERNEVETGKGFFDLHLEDSILHYAIRCEQFRYIFNGKYGIIPDKMSILGRSDKDKDYYLQLIRFAKPSYRVKATESEMLVINQIKGGVDNILSEIKNETHKI